MSGGYKATKPAEAPAADAMMCQLCLKEPGAFEWSEPIPVPVPGPGEVLMRTGAVGMCGTDFHAFDGNQNFFTYPRVLGHEIGATVAAFGPDCEDSGLKVGDKCAVVPYWECGTCIACKWGKPNCCKSINVIGVHSNGALRNFFVAPKSKLCKSDKLPLDQLALVETLCIGAHGVFRGQPRKGESALIIGAGPVGMGTAQFAKAAGCKVTIIDINQQRLDFVGKACDLPKENLINSRPAGKEGYDPLDDLIKASGGDLPTLVFECTGNIHSMKNSFNFVAFGGKLVFVGHTKLEVSYDNPLFHSREMTICASRNALASDFSRVIALIENGEVNVEPWITHRCTLKNFEESFKAWKDPATGVIKGIVELDN